ncbi:hypothetical protein COHA_005760 [Chlorella ohadii]|uniref:Uncharacterized protein n=1 Tax=Chlorella ohadii TaxID=2649997 RepID=A0AAD5DQB8_9CHLO|nr:hypothetical protein COHA_005760 [Chlorella ohadii]
MRAAAPCARHPSLLRGSGRPGQRYRRPALRPEAASAAPPGDRNGGGGKQGHASAPLAWWHHWLQWPQLAAPSRQQNMPQYEALQRTAAEQALWDETLAQLIVRAQQGLESTRKEAELARQFNESMEWPSRELKEQWEARQQAQPNASAAAAVAWASAAAGNEAAAVAAAQRADMQPAAYAASAAGQWDRAAAAWRAAYDSLEAAAQADPGSEAVQQAAAAVEAARGFRRQLLSEQG